MVALPAQVATATVTAVLTSAVVDGSDPDLLPDAVPLSGQVVFTPDRVNGQLLVPTATPPLMVTVRPMPFALAGDGSLSANLVVIPGATYTVSFALNVPIASFSIGPLVAGQTYDLASLAPVTALNGVQLTKGDPGTNGVDGSNVLPTDTAIANAFNTPASATRAVLNAAFAVKVAGVFPLTNYGTVDTTGVTNSNAAWNACIADWYAKGGGTIRLPLGTITVTTQTFIPSGNPSGSGMLQQPPLKIQGIGGHASGQRSKGSGGTRLNLTYQGAASPAAASDAKIVTYGSGLLVFKDIVLMDSTVTNSSTPFVYTTGTTIKTDSTVAVIGSGTGGFLCAQDAFVLGGTLKFPVAPIYPANPNYGSVDAPFQGYGSSFIGTYFNFIRRAVYGRSYANQVIVDGCFLEKDCGTNLAGGAAIEFDASLTNVHPGDNCASNVIINNYIEVIFYSYGVKTIGGNLNTIAHNGCEDAGGSFVSAVRLEGHVISATNYGSVFNTVIGNLATNSVTLSEDAMSAGQNTLISAYSEGSRFASPVVFNAPLTPVGNFLVNDKTANRTLEIYSTTNRPAYLYSPLTLTGNAYNGSAAGTTTIKIGDGTNVSDASITLNPPAGSLCSIQTKQGGVNQWLLYDAGAAGLLFLRDSVNGVMLATFTGGSGTTGELAVGGAFKVAGNVGFYGHATVAKPTVTGAKGSNAALTSLIAALVSQGLIADTTTA